MSASFRFLTFLCSGAGYKKLSFRIASRLQAMGLIDIGTLQHLSEQHATQPEQQRKMIFINDCRSGCVNVFTHGFVKENYIFLDISSHAGSTSFDIEHYIINEVLPRLKKQWNDAIG